MIGNKLSKYYKDPRVIIAAGILLCLLVMGLVVTISKSHTTTPNTKNTGGNYFPRKTYVVFYNADNLYAPLRNEDIENLRSQLDTFVQQKYGQGQYRAKVLDDKVNYLPTDSGIPPSFWFTLTFDGHPGSLRVNVDLSTGVAVFSLAPGA